jgi:hypothetical protein
MPCRGERGVVLGLQRLATRDFVAEVASGQDHRIRTTQRALC